MTTCLSILIFAAAVAPAPAPGVVEGPQTIGTTATPGGAAAPAAAQAGSTAFSDIHSGLEGASSQDCLGCHGDTWPVIRTHASHPIDLDYAAVAGKGSGDLRPLPDVLARGIAVPDGKVACLTCHALASSWKYRLAMPAGATPRPAIRVGDPASYEKDSTAPPQPGSEVSPKPLCLACHRF